VSGLAQAATRATAVIGPTGLGYCLVGGFAVSSGVEFELVAAGNRW
jgi:hypothetical protein